MCKHRYKVDANCKTFITSESASAAVLSSLNVRWPRPVLPLVNQFEYLAAKSSHTDELQTDALRLPQ